jgi:hypothetical protein
MVALCGDIEFVRFMHNGEPFISAAFSFTDQSSHPVDQYFGTCTGQRVKSCFF